MRKIGFILLTALTLTILCVGVSASSAWFDVNERFGSEEFTYEDTTLPYRIYVPEDYSEDSTYPLVVFLHGAGERGTDNEKQLSAFLPTLFNRRDGMILNAIVIAPQCPEDNKWVDTPWELGNYFLDETPESNELKTVVALIEKIKNDYSVDTDKVYAVGLSMGGFGVWDLLMRHSEIFAAGIPMCGGGDPTKASILADIPIYTFHGTVDEAVPFDGTAEMVYTIEEVEFGTKINFGIYNAVGHGIWDKVAQEEGILEWLFAQNLSDRKTEEPATSDTDPVTDAPDSTADTAPAESDSENDTSPVTSGDKNGGDNTILIVVIAAAVVVVAAAIVGAVLILKKK